MRPLFVSIAFLVPVGSLQSQYKSIDDMKIEKIGLGTSLLDFRKAHPKAKRVKELEEPKVVTYLVTDDPECFSFFSFLDGEMLSMAIHWTGRGVEEAGGAGKIVARIEDKYGPPDQQKGGDSAWISGKSGNRLVLKEYDDNSLVIFLSSKESFLKLIELQKQSKRPIVPRRID